MTRSTFLKIITFGAAAVIAGVKAVKKFAGWDVGYMVGISCLYDADGKLMKKWVGSKVVYDSERDERECKFLIKKEMMTAKQIKERYPSIKSL